MRWNEKISVDDIIIKKQHKHRREKKSRVNGLGDSLCAHKSGFQIMVEKSENMDDNENYLEVRKNELVCGAVLVSFPQNKKKSPSLTHSTRYQLQSNLRFIRFALQLSKMNFSPFTTSFANVNVNQFAKFTQNLATPSQVRRSIRKPTQLHRQDQI